MRSTTASRSIRQRWVCWAISSSAPAASAATPHAISDANARTGFLISEMAAEVGVDRGLRGRLPHFPEIQDLQSAHSRARRRDRLTTRPNHARPRVPDTTGPSPRRPWPPPGPCCRVPPSIGAIASSTVLVVSNRTTPHTGRLVRPASGRAKRPARCSRSARLAADCTAETQHGRKAARRRDALRRLRQLERARHEKAVDGIFRPASFGQRGCAPDSRPSVTNA